MASKFEMIDVGGKSVTRRKAIAKGVIQLSKEVCSAIVNRTLPKGDVLTLAEVSGITAAKKTSDLLPLCHPLTLDKVKVSLEVNEQSCEVFVSCEVITHGKTGVEMEALTGVTGALLCIYDLTKGIDKAGSIKNIYLEHKEGGKSGDWWHPEFCTATATNSARLRGIKASILTVSDSISKGKGEDLSGSIIESYLRKNEADLSSKRCIPDDVDLIREAVRLSVSKENVDILVITGGTGIGPRDVTPDALSALWSKKLPGFGEMFRNIGQVSTPRAWLSRAEAGVIEDSLVFLLPGSPSGVRDGVSLIHSHIEHMLSMIRGERH